MQNTVMKRSAIWVAGALGLAGAFFAGAAYASADARFSEANDHVTQALVLLNATQTESKAVASHRSKAIADLTRGQAEIVKAIQAAE